MSTSYAPQPDTLAAHALEFIQAELRDRPKGAWLLNTKIAKHLGCKPNAIWPSLIPAVNAGVLERSQSHNRATQWRMAQPRRRTPVKVKKAPAEFQRFSIDWPPRFEPKFDTVFVPAWDGRK